MSIVHKTKDFEHPELQEGEVFCCNIDQESFSALNWKSKRKGKELFDTEGKKLEEDAETFPVFVKQEELKRLREEMMDARREWFASL